MNLTVVFQRAVQKYIVLVLLTPKFLPVLVAISPPVFPLFLTVCLFQKGGWSSQWDARVEY